MRLTYQTPPVDENPIKPRYGPTPWTNHVFLPILAFALLALAWARPLGAQTNVGQWDFETGDLSASAGSNLGDLDYLDGAGGATELGTQFGATTSFGIPNINGTNAYVMKFPAATGAMGYVLYPAGSAGRFRPLLEPDEGDDGSFSWLAINSGDAPALTNSGSLALGSGGQLQPNTWHRVGFVLHTSSGSAAIYLNGAPIATLAGLEADNPYTLVPSILVRLLGNSDADAAVGYVNSIQIRDVPLTPGQMSALGGPSASGVPLVIPLGTLTVTSITTSGGNITMNWAGGTAPYIVERKSSLTNSSWTFVQATSLQSITLPAEGGIVFLRVRHGP